MYLKIFSTDLLPDSFYDETLKSTAGEGHLPQN